MEIFGVIAELGFTITAVLGGGVFIVILLKYILASVVDAACEFEYVDFGVG